MVEQTLPVLQTAGLCKTFKDFWRRPRVEAVRDLNLEIRPGEVFGLLGPNGSGKTTTIKMLLGLLFPTRGRIAVFGKSPSDVSVKARIGFLPEESYLYRFLVAHETLDFYGRLFRIPSRIRKDRIDRLLDMVGLRHEAKRRVGEYSKGMARRIGLAQALINDPEFLILDEPTSGLDPVGARQIKDVIRDLGRKGKTILLSSHVLSDVEDVCDRVTILYGGSQQAAGDIGELLQKRDITQITTPHLSEETIEQLRDLIQRLEKKDIVDVSHPRQRLEDFFLQIVQDAQAANIKTSGATAGGEIPDFLKKPTASTTDEVIESLVMRRSLPERPEASAVPTQREAAQDPSSDVLAQLLQQPEAQEDKPAPSETSAPQPPAIGSGAPVVADPSVIDSLLKSSDDRDGDKSEKAP